MKEYLSLVKDVLENGEIRDDRTNTGTISIFGAQRKYDLREGFPLVTSKKTLFNAIVHELLWFLKGSTNINDGLKEHTPIWNAWADESGDLGPIYGYQWIKWPKHECQEGECKVTPINQIQNAIDQIKTNPNSRRIIVSAWNAPYIDEMALPPCHTMFQFYVANGRLDLQLYQRSADLALGVPFNIASYALLLTMVAQECNLTPGIFVHTIGDAHIYLNHVQGIKKQLEREPLERPTVKISKKPIFELKFEDFQLENYKHHKFIKYPIAV